MIARLLSDDLMKADSMEQENKPTAEGSLVKLVAILFYFQVIESLLQRYLGVPDPLALTVSDRVRSAAWMDPKRRRPARSVCWD